MGLTSAAPRAGVWVDRKAGMKAAKMALKMDVWRAVRMAVLMVG